jgi:predicted ribosome quality control (RQC) complex YloA/Tae2 family protein
MPFDGLAMRAVTTEIMGKLVGGRVEKVLQPERDEIHLVFRNNYENHKLLISASANFARVHITNLNKPNPDRAPIFCMLLRKHLIGGKLLAVEQQGLERVVSLRFGVIDELGLAGELVLYVEIMGKHSNAVLVHQDGTIVDALKRVTEEKSRVREVLPGIPYELPPSQGKRNALALDAEAFHALLAGSTDKPVWQALCDSLSGLAQATAKELLLNCGLDPMLAASEFSPILLGFAAKALAASFSGFSEGAFEPTVLETNGEASDFLPFRCAGRDAQRRCESMSGAVEAFFASRDLRDRLKQSSSNMTHVLGGALKRAQKKLEKQEEELVNSASLDVYRLKGELLTANLHLAQKGQKSIETVNYYSESAETMIIELDPMLSPSENAQRYFKKYAKAKSAQEKLTEQLAATQQETEYIEGQLQNIAQSASEGELEEIRVELAAQGYLRDAAKARRKIEPSKPRHYRSPDGHDIYVGRNNTQNDYLTLKFARGDDVWMHTKKIPGSHVIIRAIGGAVSDRALDMGAMLAAYFSKARASSGVPVDYTQKRNVKKPTGARPGYVIYLTNQTVVVTPDEEYVKKLVELKE